MRIRRAAYLSRMIAGSVAGTLISSGRSATRRRTLIDRRNQLLNEKRIGNLYAHISQDYDDLCRGLAVDYIDVPTARNRVASLKRQLDLLYPVDPTDHELYAIISQLLSGITQQYDLAAA